MEEQEYQLSMHPFVLMSLLACVVCSTYVLTASPSRYDSGSRRATRRAKWLFGCVAVWAFCEVCWNLAGSVAEGERFLWLGEAAIIMIGPITMDLSQSMAPHRYSRIRRRIHWLYGIAAVMILSTWSQGWLYSGLAPVPWGHSPIPGTLFPLFYGFVAGCGLFGLLTCRRIMRDALDLNGNLSGRGVVYALIVLLVVSLITDLVLPLLEIQTPRLSSSAFACVAGAALFGQSRPQGYVFASEAMISREILRVLHEGVVFLTFDDRVLLANEKIATFVAEDPNEIIGRPFRHHLPELSLDHPQERIDIECELVPASGPSISVATSITTVRDDRGEPMGLVVVIRDLRELKLLRGRLITSGRLAAVGQLAAGIAHEINNPIAFVRTNLSVLRGYWATISKALMSDDLDEAMGEILHDGEEIIDESIDGVDRAARVVRNVREFSQAGTSERELVELVPLLDQVARVAAPELGPGITIERDYQEVPMIPASSQQLQQVFLNLLVNALDAVEGQGTITISTSHDTQHVSVRISDDGCGIPPELTERIFDPFFTTKTVGEGTGLGLSISHEIVRTHGGLIYVEPREGPGTCFCVRLPLECNSAAGDSEEV